MRTLGSKSGPSSTTAPVGTVVGGVPALPPNNNTSRSLVFSEVALYISVHQGPLTPPPHHRYDDPPRSCHLWLKVSSGKEGVFFPCSGGGGGGSVSGFETPTDKYCHRPVLRVLMHGFLLLLARLHLCLGREDSLTIITSMLTCNVCLSQAVLDRGINNKQD